jgi:hypothetical protein
MSTWPNPGIHGIAAFVAILQVPVNRSFFELR